MNFHAERAAQTVGGWSGEGGRCVRGQDGPKIMLTTFEIQTVTGKGSLLFGSASGKAGLAVIKIIIVVKIRVVVVVVVVVVVLVVVVVAVVVVVVVIEVLVVVVSCSSSSSE